MTIRIKGKSANARKRLDCCNLYTCRVYFTPIDASPVCTDVYVRTFFFLFCFFPNIFLRFQGLIKSQTSTDKELSGMTLRDLWENSPNAINKPLAHIGGGLSVSRANAGERVRQKVGPTICCGDARNATPEKKIFKSQ